MDPFLVMPDEGGRRQSLESKQCWRIGRGADNDIVIDNQWISRYHAMFQRVEGGSVYLIDLGSRNGSLINGQRVIAPAMLHDGDRLLLGRVPVEFYSPESPEELVLRSRSPEGPEPDMESTPTAAFRERRLVSVVVVDIRGFTPLVRSIDDRLASDVIATFHARTEQVLLEHGSWGGKSTGDGQMAIWAHDDEFAEDRAFRLPGTGTNGNDNGDCSGLARADRQCVRLLHAILDIAGMTEALQARFSLPAPLRIGAGVSTGYAVVGNTGRDQPDYTVLGDTVNAAFRLESATRQIGADLVIGQSTYDRLFQPGPELQMVSESSAAKAPFTRHLVQLKGYDGQQPVYACCFDELGGILKSVPI